MIGNHVPVALEEEIGKQNTRFSTSDFYRLVAIQKEERTLGKQLTICKLKKQTNKKLLYLRRYEIRLRKFLSNKTTLKLSLVAKFRLMLLYLNTPYQIALK